MNQDVSTIVREFLFDSNRRELIFQDDGRTHSLLKSRFDDDTDILYHMYQFHQPYPQSFTDRFEYEGIVSYRQNAVYDRGYNLQSWVETGLTRDALIERTEQKLEAAVLLLIDGKPVPVTDDVEELSRREREDFLHYHLESEAEKAFFDYQQELSYRAHPNLKESSLGDVVRMINDEAGFIQESASAFVRDHAYNINERLWQLSMVQQRLDEINDNPGDLLVRRLVADCICKYMQMVNVTLCKGDITITMKLRASSLAYASRDDGCIRTYSMDNASRKQFEQAFGWNSSLEIPDIIKITYGKKVLFAQEQAA